MIIARGDKTKGGQLLLLGLSRDNVNRLTDGKPVRIRRESHGEGVPADWEIIIFFGETEAAMEAQLVAMGAIGADTKVTVDPRLGNP